MNTSIRNNLIPKISDFLENRQKTNNFGTCKKCSKNVYWSTSKIASHIRSGHCKGCSPEEILKFKQEFVYESPKHLIHRSFLGLKTTKDTTQDDQQKIVIVKREHGVKRQKMVLEPEETVTEEYQIVEENNETEEVFYEIEANQEKTDEEFAMYQATNESPQRSEKSITVCKEEKFINVVYPQYKGLSKLQLIDEILDLQRRNELLQVKAKTYEDTINKLL